MTTDIKTIPTKRNVSAPAPRTGKAPLFEEATLPDPHQAVPAVSPELVEGPPSTSQAAVEPQHLAARPQRPTDLAGAYPWLLKPFAKTDIELKPGAITKDRSRALAMPFADMRVYFVRLDKICGVENWSHTIVLSERGAVCHLTIFGITKSGAGDYPRDAGDENAATSAEAQSFKRACAAFGLGRYLYNLPQIWGAYSTEKKCFVDPAQLVREMYESLDCNAGK